MPPCKLDQSVTGATRISHLTGIRSGTFSYADAEQLRTDPDQSDDEDSGTLEMDSMRRLAVDSDTDSDH